MTPELLACWETMLEYSRDSRSIDKKGVLGLAAYSEAILAVDAEREALRAQVARLVDALEQIANAQQNWRIGGSYAGGETNHGFVQRLKRIAAAAVVAATAQSAREWMETHDESVETETALMVAKDIRHAIETGVTMRFPGNPDADWIIQHSLIKDGIRFRWLLKHEEIGFSSGDREPSCWVETIELRKRIDEAIREGR